LNNPFPGIRRECGGHNRRYRHSYRDPKAFEIGHQYLAFGGANCNPALFIFALDFLAH
jgi:hypothetical protein